MTRQQFTEDGYRKLAGILLRAYHTKITDAALLFRMETADAELIEKFLGEAYDSLQPSALAPSPAVDKPAANGKPQTSPMQPLRK